MKCDLHTLDLGLQHSGCFWKLLLSLPILLFLASGCCSSVVDTVFHSSLEAEVTVSRVGSTLCVGSPSPSPPPSANLPTINRGWKKSLHDCLLLLLPGSCCCFVGVDGLDCDTVVLKWLKPAKNNLTFCDFTNFSQQLFRIVSVSGHSLYALGTYSIKICQIVAGFDKTIQGLLEFIWTEGCSGRSLNPGPALAILVVI